ncbi:MAG TPA: hypothetical protein PLJ21_13470 [Pseudobdellovibrionaceae bacterium]|nr:hypothetical protein [Pseudobdellovibrionaceae bacterium]
MKKYFVLFLVTAMPMMGLISCREIDGKLSVVENLTVTTMKSDPWCNPDNVWENCNEQKTFVVGPGEYSAVLEPKSKEEALLKIKFENKEEPISIKIPKGKKIPENSGTFLFKASEIGQTWDLSGAVDTVKTTSETHRLREHCEYEVQRRVCGPGGPPHYEQKCWIEVVRFPGTQYVEYYYNYYDKSVVMNLMNPSTGYSQANWSGKSLITDKIYTYRGTCR